MQNPLLIGFLTRVLSPLSPEYTMSDQRTIDQ